MNNQHLPLLHFYKNAISFTKDLLKRLEQYNLQGQFKWIDHICYRVETIEDYQKWKRSLSIEGKLLSEAIVNGRPISSFKLHKKIVINSSYEIDVIELPAPRPDKKYQKGFEHIELVSLGPLGKLVDHFKNIHFNTKNISAPTNRCISLSFEEGVVKFHESSLEDIIKEELNKGPLLHKN